MEKKKVKAIALISGGLDSTLAARVVMEQGIEVQGVCFVIGFASKDNKAFEKSARERADKCGIPLKVIDVSKEFMEVLGAPRHGYGANINPCIDCKTFMLKKAKEMMTKEGYDFLITGEVLGQRPMSQRRDALNIIRKDSGLDGYLLRPLSAKLLEETVAERTGLVDRARLLDLRGRTRKPQMELAKKYGMEEFAQPAGGCLLTDPGFAARLKDLMANSGLSMDDIALLKVGRHFRLDQKTKAVVGRDEKENELILSLKKEKDAMLQLVEDPGPYALLRGDISAENLKKAAVLVVSHSKKKAQVSAEVEWWVRENDTTIVTVSPLNIKEIEKTRI
jgi:tRNA-specific 2-thiouridylase